MPNRAIPIPPLARQVTDRADQVRRSRLLNELDEALSRAEARSPKKASQPRPVPYQPINSNQGLTDDQAQTLFPNLPLTWSTGTRQLFERQGRGEVFDEDYTEPVDVSPPEDHKWHPLSEQTKATVRTKMSRCFPPPDAPTVGPRTQSIIENLRAKTAALLNHPRAIELAITTP
ncbi:MAG TPA: hypothetical protein VEJ84_14920, partial [Acidimicrobiales bacterium]|nr:hypothetical protein [Acidimicrobiales bacterium]